MTRAHMEGRTAKRLNPPLEALKSARVGSQAPFIGIGQEQYAHLSGPGRADGDNGCGVLRRALRVFDVLDGYPAERSSPVKPEPQASHKMTDRPRNECSDSRGIVAPDLVQESLHVLKCCTSAATEQSDGWEVFPEEAQKALRAVFAEMIGILGARTVRFPVGGEDEEQASGAEDPVRLGDEPLVIADMLDRVLGDDSVEGGIRESELRDVHDEIVNPRLLVPATRCNDGFRRDIYTDDESCPGERVGAEAGSTGGVKDSEAPPSDKMSQGPGVT